MRAADALFARPAPQPVQRPVAATSIATASAAAADGSDTVVSSSVPDRGGRILRALDEPPPPQLVALEAAHAPKRRGRKPGSKNKPKIKPVEVAGDNLTDDLAVDLAHDLADASPAGLFAGGMSEGPAPLAAQTTMQANSTRADSTLANSTLANSTQADTTPAMRRLQSIPAAPASPTESSNGSPPNGSKRFPWVRDRLKPGEGWKRRRLPRICW